MDNNREFEDKLYFVKRRKDCHISLKENQDGSKSAIQFTNEGNHLKGPVDLIEVNKNDFMGITDRPRTFQEIILEDVIAPVARECIYQVLMTGYDKLCTQIKEKVIPDAKVKFSEKTKDARIIALGIKDALNGKEPKISRIIKEDSISVDSLNNSKISEDNVNQEKVTRSMDEVYDILNITKSSAAILAACIRMLNNTVIEDDGSNPEIRIEIQNNLRILSSTEVMERIDFLLEEKNAGLLDVESRNIMASFRNGYFGGNNCKIAIEKYID